MSSNLQDLLLIVASFLLILGGVTYWLYTAIEQNQRKIGVLENVLYELRFTIQEKLSAAPLGSGSQGEHRDAEQEEEVKPDQDAMEVVEEEEKVVALNREYSEPPESVVEHTLKEFDDDLPGDGLRPGGILDLNEDEILNDWNKKPASEEANFKNLFVGSNASAGSAAKGEATPLDSMSLKELRSMASQRKIAGVKNMKRSELVEALRTQLPSVDSPQNVIRSLE
jgi:Rho termination factor, N-terminal domain